MANLKIVHVDLDTGEFLFRTPIPGTVGSFVLKSGDIMTGYLQLNADPVDPLHAATKQYVDSVAMGGGSFLPLSGGTLTGPLTLDADPVNPLHAATKQYVDTTNNNLTHTHIQSTAASIWSVNHNKNTNNFIAQVYIDNELVVPDGIVIIDSNNVDVILSVPSVGQVNFILWS